MVTPIFKKADCKKLLSLTGIIITANEDFMASIKSSDELYVIKLSQLFLNNVNFFKNYIN